MTELLDVLNFDYAARGPRGVPPKMMEFPVAVDAAPYLVSSTRGVVWAKRASRNRTVKAAVRSVTGFYEEVVTELAHASVQHKWGSVNPLTMEGLEACVKYLAYFGLTDLEQITHEEFKWPEEVAEWPDSKVYPVSHVTADWAPKGAVLILPRDRGLFGFMGSVGTSRICAVVHNATRGFTLAGEL